MVSYSAKKLGVMFRREHPPEHLPEFARRVEEAGFDSLWLVEDCFYGSGVASAAVALGQTKSIKVGLGIMPAVVRNPVFTAMEIATLGRLFPGRFLPGIGHGVASWMNQIGAMPDSQLSALEETAAAIQNMLSGETVSYEGSEVRLQSSRLHFPPAHKPPLYLGVRGPKSLALSGRVADGTILAELAAPAYISWARKQIARGQRPPGQIDQHHITVFAFTYINSNKTEATIQLRPIVAEAIASGKIDAQIAPMGILPEVREILERGGRQLLENELPEEWIHQLSVAGTADDCVQAIRRIIDAGADTVVLVPLPQQELGEVEVFSRELLPLLNMPAN